MASSDPGWVVEHLVADSFLFLKVLPAAIRSVLDVGSGAGFPGIPLKIVRPHWSLTLVESRQRRASFLRAVVRELRLADVHVVDQRLETLSPVGPGFDVATMRCAGDPGRLLATALDLVRPGGLVVASGPPPAVAGLGDRRPRHGPRYPQRSADAGEPGGARLDHARLDQGDSGSSAFERVVVPGLRGGSRQFLVARKS